MSYEQLLNCDSWQFPTIPEFHGGIMQPLFADCGSGLNAAADDETADNSFMHIFAGVKAEEIESYAGALEANGFEKIYFNRIDGNLFYQFAAPEGLFYISFMSEDGTARMILDRCEQTNARDFGGGNAPVRENTVFAQYSLHYDKMIKGTTCDCGMNYVYRLRDNSLFIIDGGEMEQATDSAVRDYMEFIRSLTGTEPGEKIRISLWLCTHAHNDHCDFFSKLLRFHADELIVERAAFNFPANSNLRHSDSVLLLKRRLCEKFPGCSYIKLHAGEKFSLSNAEIEILLSAEDAVFTDPEDPFPCMNATSTVFTVAADGVKTLFLADCCDDDGKVLTANYGKGTLTCDILQAAHHGINEILWVYEKITAKTVLLPQCLMNMETRFAGNLANLRRLFGENSIRFAHDSTFILTFGENRSTESSRAHVGEAYDGSEW